VCVCEASFWDRSRTFIYLFGAGDLLVAFFFPLLFVRVRMLEELMLPKALQRAEVLSARLAPIKYVRFEKLFVRFEELLHVLRKILYVFVEIVGYLE